MSQQRTTPLHDALDEGPPLRTLRPREALGHLACSDITFSFAPHAVARCPFFFSYPFLSYERIDRKTAEQGRWWETKNGHGRYERTNLNIPPLKPDPPLPLSLHPPLTKNSSFNCARGEVPPPPWAWRGGADEGNGRGKRRGIADPSYLEACEPTGRNKTSERRARRSKLIVAPTFVSHTNTKT